MFLIFNPERFSSNAGKFIRQKMVLIIFKDRVVKIIHQEVTDKIIFRYIANWLLFLNFPISYAPLVVYFLFDVDC